MTKRLVWFLLVWCLTAVMQAGAQDTAPGRGRNPSTTPDCADPLLATSLPGFAQNHSQAPLPQPTPAGQSAQNNIQLLSFLNFPDNENLSRPGLSKATQRPLPPEP